ncbi:antA/AntB antirepressor family protein [Klebsiella michiganensis]|uniref:antA/AntB antirepressor family protein n=1 Tax=Klebsiella michiganensis TaxID=1134687 RepID=UPI002245C510|nr:antA/AntB antirepressor family protein [Klebsiella michiganensis]MCW9640985.1 antA/AntB antirepressor family protein [Klebsiella michiganensis]
MKKNHAHFGQGFAHAKNDEQQNFAEMIPVITGVIGRHASDIVNARTLHSALGVRRDFTNWIKGRIAEYGFTEGIDFEVVESLSSPNSASSKSRQQIMYEYLITLHMGKELSMVERTEQGRAIRHYFIKCEEELRRRAPEKAAALRRELKARINVASYFKPMCAALEAYRADQGKTTLQHHYTTESNMLARIVLGGMTAKQWAKVNGIAGEPRDSMNTAQLEHLSYLEQTNITLLELGKDYPQRRAELLRLSQRWLSRRMEVSYA